jgi:hypothetical protein
MKIVVLDNDAAVIWVYPEKQIIHHKFKKFVYGDAFKEIMLKAADAFRQNKCTKWLSDDRENGALRPVDRDWAYQEWGSLVVKSGWKHWALLPPKMTAGQMNMRQISGQYMKLGINFKGFTDPDEALRWLEIQ